MHLKNEQLSITITEARMSRACHALSAPIAIFSAHHFIFCFWNKRSFVKKVVHDKDDTNGGYLEEGRPQELSSCAQANRGHFPSVLSISLSEKRMETMWTRAGEVV